MEVLRYLGDPVVGSGLPEPVGSGFGGRPIPFDNVARLIAQRPGFEQKPAIFIKAPEPSFKPASHTELPYCAPLHQHALLVVRMRSPRPASFDLVQCEAGIVEGWPIEEVGDTFRSGTPTANKSCFQVNELTGGTR